MYFQSILPYNRKSSELFAKIRHQPHAVFLQSAAKSVGRYDIISANPTLIVTATPEKASVIRDNILETISGDPIDFLITQ